ncbi:MAG: 5-oxoprolinase subunit C family protein [Roseinatronobacter sp.]
MKRILLHRVGPGVTVQDGGRPGFLAQGLSRGGAADRLALEEGAALLGQDPRLAALEIAGSFLSLEVSASMHISLTGAPMRALHDGAELRWHASHLLPAGAQLDLSSLAGGYSYVNVGGGVAVREILGARSAHLACGLGAMLQSGASLPVGKYAGGTAGMFLTPLPRFDGGMLRIVETPQTQLFPMSEIERFEATIFRKDTRGNRMGQRLIVDGAGFGLDTGLSILSETIVPGDIQITGDGAPFVLLSECQTTGGYPRIGTVLPCDLPCLVQARAGAELRFRFVSQEDAIMSERAEAARRAGLRKQIRPLVRDPRDMHDLLSYQLVSGVTSGDDLERETT